MIVIVELEEIGMELLNISAKGIISRDNPDFAQLENDGGLRVPISIAEIGGQKNV